MASGDPKTLVTGIRNTTGAALANAEVQALDLQTNTEDTIDFVNTTDRGKFPSIVIPRFQHQTTIGDDEYCSGVAAGKVLAKVDGSSTNTAIGDLLKVTSGSSKFTKWENAADIDDAAGSVIVAAGTVHTNSTTETDLATHTQAANTLQAGDVLRFYGQGLVIDNNSTDTLTITVRFGDEATTASREAVAVSPAINVNDNDIWVVKGEVVIRTTTTVVGSAIGVGPDAGSTVAFGWGDVLASATVDVTAVNYLSVTGDWSVAHAENQVRADQWTVEHYRPSAPGSVSNAALMEYVQTVRAIATSVVTTDTEADVILINNPLMMGV